MGYTFQYRSDIQEISQLREDLGFMKEEWHIPESEIRQILVILEELFSNVVRYAFHDSLVHHIVIRIDYTDSRVEIEMIDDGMAFNPVEYQATPSSDPVISVSGGMGLSLIKAFSSSMSYERTTGKNHIFISKKIKNL
jgi:anti-sigma regulatory factor (Ser/Thr protein kinase)